MTLRIPNKPPIQILGAIDFLNTMLMRTGVKIDYIKKMSVTMAAVL